MGHPVRRPDDEVGEGVARVEIGALANADPCWRFGDLITWHVIQQRSRRGQRRLVRRPGLDDELTSTACPTTLVKVRLIERPQAQRQPVLRIGVGHGRRRSRRPHAPGNGVPHPRLVECSWSSGGAVGCAPFPRYPWHFVAKADSQTIALRASQSICRTGSNPLTLPARNNKLGIEGLAERCPTDHTAWGRVLSACHREYTLSAPKQAKTCSPRKSQEVPNARRPTRPGA